MHTHTRQYSFHLSQFSGVGNSSLPMIPNSTLETDAMSRYTCCSSSYVSVVAFYFRLSNFEVSSIRTVMNHIYELIWKLGRIHKNTD